MRGKAGRRDVRRAEAVLRKACDGNDPAACHELGALFLEGLPRDDDAAMALQKKACDAGHLPGCGDLAGLLLTDGAMRIRVENEPDVRAAVSLAQKACEGGYARACTILGNVHWTGKVVPRDQALAKQMLERGCDVGDWWGCTTASSIYDKGWGGGPPDKERAATLNRKAFELIQKNCTEELDSCAMVARWHAKGIGTAVDREKQRSVLRDACDRGDSASCVELGALLEQDKPTDIDGAVRLYRRECDDGYGDGCDKLAKMYSRGLGVPRDGKRHQELLQRACDLGYAKSCSWLGTMSETGMGTTEDPAKSMALYRRACGLGSPIGCKAVGEALLGTDTHGIPSREAHAEALRLLVFSCDEGDHFACLSAAWVHDLGLGVPKSHAKAEGFARTACALGSGPACTWLKTPDRAWRPEWVEFVKQTKK
ncbi:MAG TPA: tetratricopeptide repeat protein [Polyangiaceae bacterium]|nr:tetratricopeptide repeat protein [Polyangiaceae bacterium]